MHSTTKPCTLPMPTRARVFDLGGLYARLEQLVDHRKARGKRYTLALVLLLVVLAKLCGEDHPYGIAQWVRARAKYLVAALGLSYWGMPCHNTYRRLLRSVEPSALQQVVKGFLTARGQGDRRVLIAIDGKTLRGTIPRGQSQGVHLLAAFLPHEGLVLMQVAVDGKENEISAAPRLLECLDLRDKVVVGDAMLSQRDLSIRIVEAGGHYIWLAKDNQPHVRQAIADLFEMPTCVLARDQAQAFPSVAACNKGHGRQEERILIASELLNDYLKWPYLGQVFRLERRFIHSGDGSVHAEVVYGLTDLRQSEATPAELLKFVRDYWGIENGLHYRRDKTLHEDATRMKHPQQAAVMATINNLVIGLAARAGWRYLPEARRYYCGNLDEALGLILCSPG